MPAFLSTLLDSLLGVRQSSPSVKCAANRAPFEIAAISLEGRSRLIFSTFCRTTLWHRPAQFVGPLFPTVPRRCYESGDWQTISFPTHFCDDGVLDCFRIVYGDRKPVHAIREHHHDCACHFRNRNVYSDKCGSCSIFKIKLIRGAAVEFLIGWHRYLICGTKTQRDHF